MAWYIHTVREEHEVTTRQLDTAKNVKMQHFNGQETRSQEVQFSVQARSSMGGKLRGILHANFDLKLYSFCVPRASERASTTLKESHSQQMESARGRHSNAAAALNPRRDALRRANFQVVKYKGFLLCRVPKANADQGHSAHLHFGRSDFNSMTAMML